MLVLAESTLTLGHSAGPEIDQGALLRVLGEMPWFPTAFLDDRYVTWTSVDGRQAEAKLRVNGREVADFLEEISTYQTEHGERWGEWRVGPVRDRRTR